MSEFVWQDTYRIVCEEISRADQFSLWRDVQKMPSEEDATISNEKFADLVVVYATRAVYEKVGNDWKEINGNSRVSLPMTVERLRELPHTLATGWVKAALAENGSIFELLNFPTATLQITRGGSEVKPESESSKS